MRNCAVLSSASIDETIAPFRLPRVYHSVNHLILTKTNQHFSFVFHSEEKQKKRRDKKMATGESKPQDGEAPSSSSSLSSDSWKERVFIPTLVAGVVGGGAGSLSRHRKVHGLSKISSTYAANFAIVTGCYCGAREFVRSTRKTGPDDLLNSAIAGFGTGALLGRLQGGQLGAIRYSIIFSIVGTTADFAACRVKPHLRSYTESIFGNDRNSQKDGWLKWPEWSPIQVLDEEAIAAKQAREQELYAQRVLGKLSKEKS